MTVFHNLCRDHHEITAPSSRLCTIWLFAHDLFSRHKKEDFITTTQTAVSTILGQVFTQTGLTKLPSHQQHLQNFRPQATPVPPASAGVSPASCTSSTSVCRFLACKLQQFSQRLQVSCFCKSHQFLSGFHAVVRILNIPHGVRARFI